MKVINKNALNIKISKYMEQMLREMKEEIDIQ